MKKVVRIIFLIFSIFLIFVFILGIFENRIERIIGKGFLEKKKIGEKFTLIFQINYLDFIPMGISSYHFEGLSLYKEEQAYLIRGEAEDTFPFSLFKPARAKFTSYLDTSDMLPLYLHSRIEMDRKLKRENEIIYHQKENYMISKGEKYVIFYPTYEPLSLIFYLMRDDFDMHKSQELNLNSNQANYTVKIEVKDKREYNVKGENYTIWEVALSVKRRKGEIMRHSMDIKAYFLKDSQMNIPLLVKAYTNVGSVLIRLTDLN